MSTEIQIPDMVQEVEEILAPGVLEKFFSTLPEKAFHLGLRILLAVIFFLVGIQVIKLVRKIIRKSMKRAAAETGAIQFVDSFVKAALYILLILMLAASFGVDAAGIVALLGSAGVAIGLAVQGSLSNLAGGVLILILKPFRVGDYIIEGATGKEGTVTEIQIFYTKLLTVDNQTVVLPNGTLAEDELVVQEKDRLVFVDELADSSVNLGVVCWFRQGDFWKGKWQVTENCKLALDEAGIEIPYPQLDVHMRQ